MLPLITVVLLVASMVDLQVSAEDDFHSVANYWGVGVAEDRGAKLPAKKLPPEVLAIMEANAKKAGCVRGCMICLSKIKCTKKMKKWLPGRCHEYAGDKKTGQGALEAAGAIEGITDDMDAMQQFNAQVEKCTDCTTRCLKGLANVKCGPLLKKYLPTRCAQFATKIQSQIDDIKGYDEAQ